MPTPTRLRLVAGLFIIGGLVAFFYMMRIASWPKEANGTDFIVPGSDGQQHVKAEILPLLGQIGGAVIGIAIVLLIIAQVAAASRRRLIAEGKPLPQPVRRRSVGRQLVIMVVVIIVALGGSVGYSWYNWATNLPSPYDEIGIDINMRLPMPLRQWACGKLHARFPGYIPPYSCGDATGKGWISEGGAASSTAI